jgi:hypothetical protein
MYKFIFWWILFALWSIPETLYIVMNKDKEISKIAKYLSKKVGIWK